MHASLLKHFNAVRAPLKHYEYLQGMSRDQLTVCAVAIAIRTAKFKVLQILIFGGLAMRPKHLFHCLFKFGGKLSNYNTLVVQHLYTLQRNIQNV